MQNVLMLLVGLVGAGDVEKASESSAPTMEVLEPGASVWFPEQQVWGRLWRRPDNVWVVGEVAKPGGTYVMVQTVRRRGLLGRTTETTTVTTVASDPYGFTVWLNQTRARYGLRPVVYDANLTAWAYQNSLRGFGHFIMGPSRRQNAGMGPYQAMPDAWMNSPGHREALLDPTIQRIGIAGVNGNVWTYNAN